MTRWLSPLMVLVACGVRVEPSDKALGDSGRADADADTDADTDADADTDTDTDADTDTDTDPSGSNDTAAPGFALVINEVLADAGTADANCDGTIDSTADEFVEIVNHGNVPVDLGGAALTDATGAERHRFAAGTVLAPDEALVVFGGGSPALDGSSGSSDPWCRALPPEVSVVVASSGSLSLNNTNESLLLTGPQGAPLAEVVYGAEGAGSRSLNLSPELSGRAYAPHDSLPGATGPWSPGTLANGAPFSEGPPPDTGGEVIYPVTGTVIFNEILFDPPSVDGDANCDGALDTSDDEYVELVNVGDETIDLSGATLEDATDLRHTFAPGTLLRPYETLLVFGAGTPSFTGVGGSWCAALPAGVTALASDRGALGLNNTGDVVRLTASDGTVLDEVTWASTVVSDASWNRQPELAPGAGFQDHRRLPRSSGAFSPGRLADGSEIRPLATTGGETGADTGGDSAGDTGGPPLGEPVYVEGASLVLNEVMADPSGFDANCDGTLNTTQDEYVELVNNGTRTFDLTGARLFDGVSVRHTFAPGTRVAPGEVLVVFGGGAPRFDGGSPVVAPHCLAWPDAVRALVASSGSLSLNNDGDSVRLEDAVGGILASATYGAEGGLDQSVNRAPELSASPLIPHLDLPGSLGAGSPGTFADGSFLPDRGPDTGFDTGPFPDTGTLDTGAGETGGGETGVYSGIGRVVVHEVLFDPDPGDLGDANCDGVRDGIQDEFIEVVNVDTFAVDLTGATLADSFGLRHVFPPGSVVAPGESVVVFGGGSPAPVSGRHPWCVAAPPGARFQTASTGSLGLNNDADSAILTAADGTELSRATWSGGGVGDESLTRSPQATDGALVAHTTLPGVRTPQSPGWTARLESLVDAVAGVVDTGSGDTGSGDTSSGDTSSGDTSSGDTSSGDTSSGDTGGPPPVGLLLNELLADPGPNDANCDGVADGSQDELLELVNLGPGELNLGGGEVRDLTGVRHRFPEPTVLAAGQTLLVFGGGSPAFPGAGAGAWCRALPPGVLVQTASTGLLGLNNTGDTVQVLAADGALLVEHTYGSEAGADQSIVRDPERTESPFVQHGTVPGALGPCSPGTRANGSPL